MAFGEPLSPLHKDIMKGYVEVIGKPVARDMLRKQGYLPATECPPERRPELIYDFAIAAMEVEQQRAEGIL